MLKSAEEFSESTVISQWAPDWRTANNISKL